MQAICMRKGPASLLPKSLLSENWIGLMLPVVSIAEELFKGPGGCVGKDEGGQVCNRGNPQAEGTVTASSANNSLSAQGLSRKLGSA